MSYHTVSIQRDVTGEKSEKEKRTADKGINSKQQGLKAIFTLPLTTSGLFIELNGLIKSNRRHPR
jgi:hypothetical protein